MSPSIEADDLPDEWMTVHRDIPMTNPLLTMVHLGAVCEPSVVRDCLERGLIARLFTVEGIKKALARFGKSGRNGAGTLRAVLEDRAMGDERPDSLLESRMRSLLRRYDLPAPIFHYVVRDNGQFIAEVDFAYPDRRLAIEVDGWSAHGTPMAMSADFVRQNRLARLGWTVLRFTWAQVMREPDYVACGRPCSARGFGRLRSS